METGGLWSYVYICMSKLLSTKQAAELKGVSVRRIQALITKGQLEAEQVGRDYVIRASDLDRIKAGVVGRPKKKKTGGKNEK